MGFSSNIHDVNMEQCVLAALMTTAVTRDNWSRIGCRVFYSDRHQQNIQGNRRAIRKQLSV